MSNYDDEQMAMDAAMHDEHKGLTLTAIGYSMLFMASITCVWIFVGWRSGSNFWLWWTMGLGILGAGLSAAGALYRARSAKDFAAVSDTMRSHAVPRVTAMPLPSRENVVERAQADERRIA